MVKKKKNNNLYKRILVGVGIFLIVIVVSLLIKGGLTKIYNMYSDRQDNEINIDNGAKNEVAESDSSYVVAIDAGHGGNDPGTSGYGMLEKDVTLDICQRLDKILRSAGIKTFMIRDGDDYMDRIERIQLANSEKTTLFLSVHCDWFEDKSFNGIRTFYDASDTLKSGNLLEQDFAQTIQDNLINKLHVKDMGLVPDSQLSVLKRAEMPSVLVEIGFLSNANDSKLLKTDDYRAKSAEALAEGIKTSLKSIK